jgi:hypothetical protein
MSYNVYIYHPDVKAAASAGAEIDEIDLPAIPDDVRQRFVERLLKYDYELETKNPNCTEYIHKNRNWSIQVAVFRTEIAFSVPYWDDAENAIFEAPKRPTNCATLGKWLFLIRRPATGASHKRHRTKR